MTKFKDLKAETKPRGRGCIVCGKDSVAVVQVMVRELNETKRTSGSVVVSRQRSLCEDHAASLGKQLLGLMP